MATLEIHLGFFAPTIAHQLRKQKFRYSPKTARILQRYSTAIGELALGGLITDREKARMRDKLFTQIKRHVVQMNRPKKARTVAPVPSSHAPQTR